MKSFSQLTNLYSTRAAVGMVIPTGIPMGMGMDEYGDCDETPWACGNSVEIFDCVEIKRKCVKYAINHSRCLNFVEQKSSF